ncbi:MAG: GerMN domain-containing protein [Chloroflexota bacterium]|nr:GerMN domain-containing protein [Chloroflexota bacterium]
MKDLQDANPCPTASSLRPRFISLVVVGVLMTFAFVLSGCSGNPAPLANAASITHASASSNTANYPVKVFFSKSPESVNTNFSSVYSVDRMSPTSAVGTFAIQLLIAGPTLSEQHAGYFTELNTMLSGPSNCSAPLPVGGPDFVLTLNKKGSVAESGTATVKFCRSLTSSGIGADARVQAQVTATLKQFPNIKKVVILTKNGHCFADESGNDLCLR